MDGHHLVLGELTDYITGERLKDTHDERYRQKLARLLVQEKGYLKSEIRPRMALKVRAGAKCALILIDFGVELAGRICMVIRYGPGSVVTRRRPALAASRLIAPYQVPLVVVTNGETAEVLEGDNGAVVSSGLESIPAKSELLDRVSGYPFPGVSDQRVDMESRILYAYEVDDSCPCDDTVCRL